MRAARFDAVLDRKPPGYVAIAAALASGEAAEAAGDFDGAVAHLRAASPMQKAAVNDDVLSRLGRAALAAGDRTKAAAGLRARLLRVPADRCGDAGRRRSSQALQDQIVNAPATSSDLGRAQLLFGARRYAEARAAFQDLQRRGERRRQRARRSAHRRVRFPLKRYAAARDGVRPYLERASRKAEARFFYLSALRELGDHDEFIAQTRALVAEFPDSSWAEEALNNLGTHYIVTNDDELAAQTFKELYEKFPTGTRAERAAWKSGWWSYKERRLRRRPCGSSRAPRSRSRAPTTGRRSSTGRRARTASSEPARRRRPGCGSSTPTTATRTTAAWPSVSSPAARRRRRPPASGSRRGAESPAPRRAADRPTA